ncbi:hypothetical protein QZH41_012236 [Actinostola sp. cb2023]|nr:hypothetical protein QZH41_012236 [Actinostola sp. cb2023]
MTGNTALHVLSSRENPIEKLQFCPRLHERTDSSLMIRGVSLTKLPLYDSSKDFVCLDGSLTIPFSSINDDYCDCKDGSDEPGTAACPNGLFHCTNAGYKPTNVPSSRVNDGICDCCDGSDEYAGLVNCPNNCKELYKFEYEKRRQDIELAKQGLAKKQEFSQQGKQKKVERKQKLDELKTQLEGKSKEVDDLRVTKEEAEASEKELKDIHDKAWEEKKAEILAERDKIAAEAAFEMLDTDHSGSITVHEIVQSKHFDKEYTDEEAKEGEVPELPFLRRGALPQEGEVPFLREERNFLEATMRLICLSLLRNCGTQSRINTKNTLRRGIIDLFTDMAAILNYGIEPKEEKPQEVPPTDVPTEPPISIPPSVDDIEDNPDVPDVDGDDDDDDDEEEEDKIDPTPLPPVPPPTDALCKNSGTQVYQYINISDVLDAELKMPEYDEETKTKIEVQSVVRQYMADNARKDYDNADSEKKNIEREINDIDQVLEGDFGDHDEFSPLSGQCFELTDREYTYKLCPFDKATQQPKNGGSDTSLGTWGEWTGEPHNKYMRMKYKGGQSCWNGPDRSTEVVLSCGSDNELTSVSEPSRCEYRMEFKSPAVCHEHHTMLHDHQEL